MDKAYKKLRNRFLEAIGGDVITRMEFEAGLKLKASRDDFSNLRQLYLRMEEKEDKQKMQSISNIL
jgi:hypothetical protein